MVVLHSNPTRPFVTFQAAMAADTIRDYLETGTIINSVNFPNTSLPDPSANAVRFTVVNKNVAGMLAHITEAFAEANLNIFATDQSIQR